MTVSGFDGVEKHVKPEKSLVEVLKKNAGRNSYGRITVRHQGGGNRQKYRVIDFKRNKLDVAAKVLRLEYDPNRSAFIALCEYFNKEIGRVWKWQSNDANTGMSMTRINTETCVRAAATISRRREKSIRLRFAPAVFSTAGTL